MMACKKQRYDGVAYYSKRVSDELFALCAIKLALFVDYKGEYSEISVEENRSRILLLPAVLVLLVVILCSTC